MLAIRHTMTALNADEWKERLERLATALGPQGGPVKMYQLGSLRDQIIKFRIHGGGRLAAHKIECLTAGATLAEIS
jgi:hypothetical protein